MATVETFTDPTHPGHGINVMTLRRIQLSIMIAEVIVGVLGNMLTIVAVAKCKFLQEKKNVLLVSLAVSDIIFVSMFLVDIQASPPDNYYKPNFSLTSTVLACAGFISSTHITFIGIERFIAITWPLHYPRIVTEKALAMAILSAWFTPVISLVPGYFYILQSPQNDQDLIRIRDIQYGFCLVTYCMFAMALCVTYRKIYYDARSQANKIFALTNMPGTDNYTARRPGNIKAFTIVLAILLAFLVSYFPYVVHGSLKLFGVDPDGVNQAVIALEIVSVGCSQANGVINVAVYAIFSKQFRRAYLHVLCLAKDDRVESGA